MTSTTPTAAGSHRAGPDGPGGPATVLTPPAPLTMRGLIILLASLLPVNMTFGAMNLLAPAIGSDLHASPAQQQLVLSGYTATFTASLFIAGRLGDRFGRRRVLVVGSAAFALVCAVSTVAPTTETLIALRVVLGVAAGLITPQILATVHATASPRLRTLGVAGFAVVGAVSTISGQVTAGATSAVLDSHLAWRAAQLVIAAVALSTLVLMRSVPPSRSDAPLDLDLSGGLMIGACLLLVVIPLTLGPASGWPLWSVAGLLAGLAVGATAWWMQHRAEGHGRLPSIRPA
ncbi:MFS family permease [Nocardioides luteus]|uniref:MFS transporter n=1 Tax=Nocardioides luteus TaxID=1844 RepID=UPI00285B2635|nr:MFS transporter [Nocardioides luteus]MDR7311313.1 MFS family permease [Nocardioides luteus]